MKIINISVRKRVQERLEEKKIEIRDLRRQDFTIIDNYFIDGWMSELGTAPSVIYFLLCRYSNKEQYSIPSIGTLAKRSRFSTRWVMKALKILEYYRLVKVDREKGQPNIYWLTDKTNWKNAIKENCVSPKEFVPLKRSPDIC